MVNIRINGRNLSKEEREYYNHQEKIVRETISNYIKDHVATRESIVLAKSDVETMSHNIAFLLVCDYSRITRAIGKAIYG